MNTIGGRGVNSDSYIAQDYYVGTARAVKMKNVGITYIIKNRAMSADLRTRVRRNEKKNNNNIITLVHARSRITSSYSTVNPGRGTTKSIVTLYFIHCARILYKYISSRYGNGIVHERVVSTKERSTVDRVRWANVIETSCGAHSLSPRSCHNCRTLSRSEGVRFPRGSGAVFSGKCLREPIST